MLISKLCLVFVEYEAKIKISHLEDNQPKELL